MREQSFAETYERYYFRLLRLCEHILHRRGDAEALAQEAFLRAWASRESFTGKQSFWPWLSTIARRLCIDHLRMAQSDADRLPVKVELSIRAVPDPGDVVVAVEEERSMRRALRKLSKRDQRLLALREVEGWSYAEISEHEGITVEAVRSSLKRARVALRRAYNTGRGGLIGVALRGRRRMHDASRMLHGDAMAMFAQALARMGDLGAAAAAMAAVVVAGSTTPAPAPVIAAPTVRPRAVEVPLPSTPSQPDRTDDKPASSPTPPPRAGTDPVVEGVPTSPLPPSAHASSPDRAWFERVTASPSGDGTVFANGRCRSPVVGCRATFRSRDGGDTWEPLPGAPLGRILLPPAYPADPRIFVASTYGLSMSADDGRTFGLVAPMAESGGAAIGGVGTDGAVRLVVSSYTGQWDYKEKLGVVAPLTQLGLAATDVVRAVRTGSDGETAWFDRHRDRIGEVVTCRNTACTSAPLTGEPYQVDLAIGSDGVWAWGQGLHRSSDDGASFQPVALPAPGRVQKVVVADDGVYASVGSVPTEGRGGLFRTRDGGRTWEKLGDHEAFGLGVREFAVLGGGRLVAAPHTVLEAGLVCSADDGRTWSRCNRLAGPAQQAGLVRDDITFRDPRHD